MGGGAGMCGGDCVEESVPRRVCEMCNGRAELFCKQEKATLCRSCDSQVHSANIIASRHERFWLCELCECGIAKVKWVSEGILLCNECDASYSLENNTGLEPRRERLGPASMQALANQREVNPSATPFELEEYAKLCNEMNADTRLAPSSPTSSGELAPVPEVVNTFDEDMKLSGTKASRTEIPQENLDSSLLLTDQVVPSSILNDIMDFNDDLDLFQPDFLSIQNTRALEYGLIPAEKMSTDSSLKAHHPEPISSHLLKPQNKSCAEVAPKENSSDESSNNIIIPGSPDACATAVKREPVSPQSSFQDSLRTSTEALSTSSKSDTVLQGFDLPPRISCMDDMESENVKLEKVEVPQEPRSVKLMRYKMKKERRRYSKKIRYQARKAYADIRPRFQGRFVKKAELEALRAAGHILV